MSTLIKPYALSCWAAYSLGFAKTWHPVDEVVHQVRHEHETAYGIYQAQ